jgi:formylglycine-generating enzyme required for sulfatase activity
VTEGEWRLCVAAGACSFDPGGDPDAPVHNLSWDDAEQYLGWLSRLTGHRYRMLSEAEWEYAARAGAGTRYWWGDQFKPDMSSCRSCGAQVAAEPPKVGLFPANAFGLHDVTGSVSQWVADCWHKNFKGAPTDGSAWAAAGCPERVLRGGSWTSAPADLRITNREFYDPKVRYPGHGLRIGRDL